MYVVTANEIPLSEFPHTHVRLLKAFNAYERYTLCMKSEYFRKLNVCI
jgi:hypothetical protein